MNLTPDDCSRSNPDQTPHKEVVIKFGEFVGTSYHIPTDTERLEQHRHFGGLITWEDFRTDTPPSAGYHTNKMIKQVKFEEYLRKKAKQRDSKIQESADC